MLIERISANSCLLDRVIDRWIAIKSQHNQTETQNNLPTVNPNTKLIEPQTA